MIEKLSKEVVEGLTDVMLNAIGPKAYDGITYAMYNGKAENDKKVVAQVNAIREAIKEEGFEPNQFIKLIKAPNGVIFDMDLQVSREINNALAQIVAKKTGNKQLAQMDLTGDGPMKRRKQDFELLIKYLISENKKGNNVVSVALFSRNFVPKIVYTAKNAQKQDVKVTINSFAIRYWDIEAVNEILMTKGYRIVNVKIGEILPTKTGVRFELQVAKM